MRDDGIHPTSGAGACGFVSDALNILERAGFNRQLQTLQLLGRLSQIKAGQFAQTCLIAAGQVNQPLEINQRFFLS